MGPTIDSGSFVGLSITPSGDMGLASAEERWTLSGPNAVDQLLALDTDAKPRWVWWGRETASMVASLQLPLDRCWDVLTVDRLLQGGWRTSHGLAWAWLHNLPIDSIPTLGQLDLLSAAPDEGDDQENPLRPDGHLRPEWIGGAWHQEPSRSATWAATALTAAHMQQALLGERPLPDRAISTARSESVAELLCAELERDGLPVDLAEVNRIITGAAGTKPTSYAHEDAIRAERDALVLEHLSVPQDVNLRNPGDVKSMLKREGLDIEDTRAWRLEQLRDAHPIIEALLHWRKDERISTTYGYRWLDEHVDGGRLRGGWSSSDGAAGRMTASAGLHNLPADMRSAIAAEAGHTFVRADLGQIEPRVLAAVSGDPAFIAATQEDDLYQPIAERLRVEREIAKVAVLGAMYGATTGQSAAALPGLNKNYPIAMGLLEAAAEQGRLGNDVFTVGGRRIRTGSGAATDGDIDGARSAAASRGRFARNALIQGAAAEFFKVWAIIVRRRARELDAQVVLCLHDELVVHTPIAHAQEVAELVSAAVGEAAHYWSPEPDVRFLADVSVIDRWSEAKD